MTISISGHTRAGATTEHDAVGMAAARRFPAAPATARRGTAVGGERGSVTAEAAVTLPLLAAVALCLVWLISIGIAQIQVVDAARDAARAVARGESRAEASASARATAPEGADVDVVTADGTATVTVAARREAPGWLLVPLPAFTVRSTSVVRLEDPQP